MRATLIDANGRTFEIEDFDLSRPLAEQRPDLADLVTPATLFYTNEPAPVAAVWKTSTTGEIRCVRVAPSSWPALEDVVMARDPEPRRLFAPDPSPYRWPAADRPGARKRRRGR